MFHGSIKNVMSFALAVCSAVIVLFASFSASAEESKFLSVEEAYPLSTNVENNQLILSWDIAENYYLYTNKVRVQVWKEGERLPVTLNVPKGKLSTMKILVKSSKCIMTRWR